MSAPAAPEDNDAAQGKLAALLRAEAVACGDADGIADAGDWHEAYLIAFGLSRMRAEALGRMCHQHAILWL